MRDGDDLRRSLERIDGRGYKAYRDIEGRYELGRLELMVDRAQGDPFAAPSRLRARLRAEVAGFPPELLGGRSRPVALRDFLARRFGEAARRIARGDRGSGKSGLIDIERPGQEILERSSVVLDGDGGVEVRFVAGLPAFGRKVAGRQAAAMLLDEVPRIAAASLVYEALDAGALERHAEIAEDADALRAMLGELDLVGFVANGAVLPRASGVDERPLTDGRVVPFRSPPSLRVEVELPNHGRVAGMGVPRGITLVAGGGYHGKSTLLTALEAGVYDHVPGDGRELVVSDPAAVEIRAEDGRRVERVDIRPFINDLPFGRDTKAFRSENASGSTSQATNIIEALEVGANTLLVDEDTSATNFMIRDHRMQELVASQREPITPFIDKVRQLRDERGVSTVLVLGGSGDYFDVADTVICMAEYLPEDVTERAGEIAERHRALRSPEGGESFGDPTPRLPLGESIDPRRGKRPVKISARGRRAIEFGRQTIDLSGVEQLVDRAQTAAIGEAIDAARKRMDGRRELAEVIDFLLEDIEACGLDALSKFPRGDLAEFRRFELAAAINRLRTLVVEQDR
ncbi:MAG: ABC-ATPase domain-containing protein [Polyangia bacterium]